MSSAVSDIAVVSLDVTDDNFRQDPFPAYEEIRRVGPVVYNDVLDKYMTVSYAGCATVLGKSSMFDSSKEVPLFVSLFGDETMGVMYGEQHRQTRGVWAKDFQRVGLETKRQLIGEVVEELVPEFASRVRGGETVEAIGAMTRALPTRVITRLLGIDPAMTDQFKTWSDKLALIGEGQFDKSERGAARVQSGVEASKELNAYLRTEMAARRQRESDDLIGHIVHAPYAQHMTEDAIAAACTQLVFAGNETTAKLMAATVVAMGLHAQQRRLVAADRSLVPQAIEEIHRWRTVTQSIPRSACSDESTVEGVRIPNGAPIMPLMAAANRDPSRWEAPEVFDVLRKPLPQIGFGYGSHSCLGLNLARLEVDIWLNRLLDLLPEFQIAGDIVYGASFALRSPVALPVAAA